MVRKPKLMISYCHANKSEAHKIHGLLEESFDILIDENYFLLSRSTYREMRRMVADADAILVLLSPASVASKAVRYEVKCALARELQEQRKIIFAGMIEPCTPMAEWEGTRLYANLHSSFTGEFAKLKRSLLTAAQRALPKATAIPDSDALAQLVKDTLIASRFKIIGNVDVTPHGKDLSDNYLSVGLISIDKVANFSAFIATLGTWTCFFYIPKMSIGGKNERTFAANRFSVRSQIGVSLAGYVAHAEKRDLHFPQAEQLIRVFRRFPRQIDVIISPYQVGTSSVKALDVKRLSWPRTRASLLFKSDNPYAGMAILPIFVAPKITNQEMLSDAVRALRSALVVELRSHGAVEGKWAFLASEPLGRLGRRKSGGKSRKRIGLDKISHTSALSKMSSPRI